MGLAFVFIALALLWKLASLICRGGFFYDFAVDAACCRYIVGCKLVGAKATVGAEKIYCCKGRTSLDFDFAALVVGLWTCRALICMGLAAHARR